MFAREAWRLLEANLETVLREPDDLEARGAMQLGAYLAGTAIENSMLGAAHACANPLTAHYGITHGMAIGILLPHVIRFNAAGGRRRCTRDLVARGRAWSTATPARPARRWPGAITDLMQSAGLPTTLSDCGVSRGILPVLAEEAAQQWTGKFNPRPVTEAEMQGLYEAALSASASAACGLADWVAVADESAKPQAASHRHLDLRQGVVEELFGRIGGGRGGATSSAAADGPAPGPPGA